MKFENIIILGAIGALGYFMLQKKPQDQDLPQQVMQQPAQISPVVVVPPVVTPPAQTITTYDVEVGAPSMPPMPETISIPAPPPPMPQPAAQPAAPPVNPQPAAPPVNPPQGVPVAMMQQSSSPQAQILGNFLANLGGN